MMKFLVLQTLVVVNLLLKCGFCAEKETLICRKTNKRHDDTDENQYKTELKALHKRINYLESHLTERLFRDSVINIGNNVVPRDCFEIFKSGVSSNGVYQISPDGKCPFEVYCDMDHGGWIHIQRRHKGDVSFQRSWNEYVSGFGDLRGDFWLGLEKIHRITQSGSQLYISLGPYNDVQATEWAHYRAVSVGDVMSGYALHVDAFGYSGSLPEALSYHNDMRFSTYDRDTDMLFNSCSEQYGRSGWWFNACFRMGNLNGVFGERRKEGIGYFTRGTKDVYVLTTEMKVMPMEGVC